MRILIVSDAWYPQINGVVRTLNTTRTELEALGHVVEVIGPDRFPTMPLPTYAEIRVALGARWRLPAMIESFAPDAIHIATEGPLGHAARGYCRRNGVPFTTAYHTRFPEYVADRAPVPLALTYAIVRRFHAPASAVMVATASIERDLKLRGFRNIRRWTRGVDTDLFRPRPKGALDAPRPFAFDHTGDRYGWVEDHDGNWHLTLYIQNGRVKDEPDLPLRTALRAIAEVHTGDFRLTANQNLIIARITPEARPLIERMLAEHGVTLGASGLRRNSMACVALPTCGLALAESERYLPDLVTELDQVLEECGLKQDAITIRSTYKHNPFLPEAQVRAPSGSAPASAAPPKRARAANGRSRTRSC